MEKVNFSYDDIVKLVDRMSKREQLALIDHLQEIVKERELTSQEWNMLLDAAIVSIPAGPNFSDRREDWYGDDGR